MSNHFSNLPLHDALLRNIDIHWLTSTVVLYLFVFFDSNLSAVPSELIFHSVTELSFSHNLPWGESSSINKIFEESGIYFIQMQSGDTLKIKCKSFELVNRSQ